MPELPTNAHEFSVSELAQSLKRTIEETYGHVRVRGELGRVTIAKSGHCYLDIKDDKAVINSIIWKGQMMRLGLRPEEGMDVIVEGRLSSYPGRSNYQLIIEKMELAGEGALMALFEKRKKAFASEGLFDQGRKKALPFMPQTIGVVTSPTGAVIRDILHRISDRFPAHVILWPVLVQGEKAAEQIAAAITGFNHAEGFPRPDVLIIGRGGGSLEDLWCFNEEIVVRAAANSAIPLISAVGHETDWTLVDYVADYRAPTPTGAAEVAVPVLSEWQDTIADYGVRISRGLNRSLSEKKQSLKSNRLPRLETVIAAPQQRLDLAAAKLPAIHKLLDPLRQKLAKERLPNPTRVIDMKTQQFGTVSSRLRPDHIKRPIYELERNLTSLSKTMSSAVARNLDRGNTQLERASKLLVAYSHKSILSRGYTLVRTAKGDIIRSSQTLVSGDTVRLTFADGDQAAIIADEAVLKTPKQISKSKPKPKLGSADQPDLF